MRQPDIRTRHGEITPWDRKLLREVGDRIKASIASGGEPAATLPGNSKNHRWERIDRLRRFGLIECCKPTFKWRLLPEAWAILQTEGEIIIPPGKRRRKGSHGLGRCNRTNSRPAFNLGVGGSSEEHVK